MVRSLLVRVLCPIVAVAVAAIGWDAEAGCHRSGRTCCEPCCEVVYETPRPACCVPARPVCCETAWTAPCPTVSCCRPRYAESAVVVVEEVMLPPARCCASAAPSPVIMDAAVVIREPSWAPAPTPARSRLIAAPASRRVR